jgi:hypothetical protein
MATEYLIEDICKYELNKNHNFNKTLDHNQSHKNNQETSLIEIIFNEKLNKTKETIQLIWILINEREEIKSRVINGLESQILRAKNLILKAEPIIPKYTRLTKVQADLDKEIFKLERAKLYELVTSWRDILGLKKQLIKLRKELKSFQNKSKLFVKNGIKSNLD